MAGCCTSPQIPRGTTPTPAARVNSHSPILIGIAFAALVAALTAFGRRLPVPPPVLQVLAGLALGFIPSVRVPELEPDLVFFVFLPPILWAAAYFTSLREFKANRRPIALLAIGLVLVTTIGVAIAARALFPGMPWAVAVALGAIVSPPDAVAAAAVVSRLPVPRRVIVILEGESLVNDASALVLYRSAVAAAVTGVFSLGESIVRFFVDAGIGTLIGLLVGWLIIRAARKTHDELAESLLIFAGPYAAWMAAETLHVSAVLACVAGGLYTRQHLSTAVGPKSRLQSNVLWEVLVFVLNAMIFVLLGMQFAKLLRTSHPEELPGLLMPGVVIALVVIVVRLCWVPIATYLPRWLDPRPRRATATVARSLVGASRTCAVGEVHATDLLDQHAGHRFIGDCPGVAAHAGRWQRVSVSRAGAVCDDGRHSDHTGGAGVFAGTDHPAIPLCAGNAASRGRALRAPRGAASRVRGAGGCGAGGIAQ